MYAESTDACVDFLESILARGLAVVPVLTVSDGAPGLCAALDLVFPDARRQRCLMHRSRNVLAKVSAVDCDAVKADFWEIFDIGEDIKEGEAAVAETTRRAEVFASTGAPATRGRRSACSTGSSCWSLTCTIRGTAG